MLRLALFPVVLLVLSIIFGVVTFVIVRKIRRGLKYTYKKGAKLANDQQQKWAEKEQRKKLPSLVQKGFDNFDALQHYQKQLPQEWQLALEPLVLLAKEVLDEVAFELTENDNEKALNSVRPFFHHSVDALLQFTKKLHNDSARMSDPQIEQARQNITLFKADLLAHQKTLQKGRKLDFDVLMDVIKARLKK